MAEDRIIAIALHGCQKDTAFKAGLKKADNPDTAYQSWEYLAQCGVNLDNNIERIVYSTILAAIARSDRLEDGSLELGRALCLSYDDGRDSDPAKARLRRLLACDNTEEVCKILRSILRIITNKGLSLNYSKLTKDLKYFDETIKARWAQQFYGRVRDEEE